MQFRPGYIKLHRSIIDWGWYHDTNTVRVFIHLLLTASIIDTECEGKSVPRGSVVCSYQGLANDLHLSVRQVRTAITHLKETHEVTQKTYPKFSVISVNNYDLYQSSDKQNDKQATSKRQACDKQATTLKEDKKIRSKKEEYSSSPTASEIKAYFVSKGSKEEEGEKFFQRWDAENWTLADGTKMRSWKSFADAEIKKLKDSDDGLEYDCFGRPIFKRNEFI